ncbi:hypothetical protein [Methylocapsa acidiphila]|uniref:hypothetical protein n=1 Tax=Methylocapsa acidiphila TaxID=133552 RepID=UPI00047990C5|nr:hypothetical protein [Methylocapsa acidiphila]
MEPKRPPSAPIEREFTFKRKIVEVTVASGETCFLYADDFERIKAYGTTLNWSLNSDGKSGNKYVRFNWRSGKRSNNKQAAWFVLRIHKRHKEQVTYLDENPLNLCRHNLIVEPRTANTYVKAARAAKDDRAEASR